MSSILDIAQTHDRAKQLMREGEYFQSKELLISCMQNPSNSKQVEIMADLASCMYVTQDFAGFRDWTQKTAQAFKHFESELSESAKLAICLKLGKLAEENGMVETSLRLYDVQFNILNEIDEMRLQKILAQKLRIFLGLKNLPKAYEIYSDLEQRAERTKNSEIDIQHALMFADAEFLSLTSAMERAQRVLEKWILTSEHKQWLVFDLMYISLARGEWQSFNYSLLDLFDYNACGLYERNLWEISNFLREGTQFSQFNLSQNEGLSKMSLLKVFGLILKYKAIPSRGEDVLKKFKLYFKSVDLMSKRIILNSYDFLELTFDEKQGGVREVKLTNHEKKIAEILVAKNQVDLEQISLELYGTGLSPATLNRIKVTVSRMNNKLRVFSNDQAFAIVHRQKLKLNVDGQVPWIA